MSHKMRIVVAETQPDLFNQLQPYFPADQYQIIYAPTGEKALRLCEQYRPLILMVDLNLADLDGIEVLRLMEEKGIAAASHKMIVSHLPEEYVEVAAFENGADDYLLKPIRLRALVKRLTAYLNSNQQRKRETTINVSSSLEINPNAYSIKKEGRMISLPKKEFRILYQFASEPHRIFTREELLAKIWESDVVVMERTVDVHIQRIRRKVGEQYIRTVKGRGYQFGLPSEVKTA